MSLKVAIITAASRGMGAAIAQELAANDYKVMLMSKSGRADQVAASLNGLAITGDVLNPNDLATLVDATIENYGRVDVVVNNTGHPPKGDLLKISDDDWHLGLDMVMLNVVSMARIVTPYMLQQGSGSILNISTFAAYEPDASFPVSASLRAALGSFTKMYADEYAPHNIRMNNLLPGFINSYPETEDIVAKIPMKRFGKVQEIAQAAHFLVSDQSSYITGQNLRVDGGLTRSV